MSVIIETTLGDITVDLYTERRPRCCINFLKLCKLKYYNYNLFHNVSRGFIAQTGDPTGAGNGGQSVWGAIEGENKKYFQSENNPRIKHAGPGLLSFVGDTNGMIGSQFFLTLGDELNYLDAQHCVFGEVVEGFDLLHKLNEVICDEQGRPFKDVRITHTIVLCDPYEDPPNLVEPVRSPSPTAERLLNGRIAADEASDDEANLSASEVAEIRADREAKARATILEMIGDIPDSEIAPPENVLFVCKLNPVTTDQDLEIIFSRFGKIKSCEVIRDKKTSDSLQYAFIEFEEKSSCENAYFKMDNVLIDDRRIHVDFSQSVAKIRWFGKGRIKYENENSKQDFGKGKYQKNTDSKKLKNNDEKNKYENDRRKTSDHKDEHRERKYYDDRGHQRNQREERSRYNKYNDNYRKNKNDDDRSRNERYKTLKHSEQYDNRYRRTNYQNEDRYREYNSRHESSNRNKYYRKEKYPNDEKHYSRNRKRSLSSESEQEYSRSKNKKEKLKKSKKKRDRSSSTDSSTSVSSSTTSSSSSSNRKSKKSIKKKSKKKKKHSKK